MENVKSKALYACRVATERMRKNMDIKWTKNAYTKYRRFSKVAIFRFLRNDKSIHHYVKLEDRHFYPLSHFKKQTLDRINVSEYQKRHEDCSLIRPKVFSLYYLEYGADYDFDYLLQKFTKSYKQSPWTVVDIADLKMLLSDTMSAVNGSSGISLGTLCDISV